MSKKVLIWGTGKIARNILREGVNAEIIGIIQTQKESEQFLGYTIYEPDEIPSEYDYIIVANAYSDEIYAECEKLAFDLSKIYFLIKGKNNTFNSNLMIKDVLSDRAFTEYMAEYDMFEGTFFYTDMERYSELNNRETFNINNMYIWPIIRDKYSPACSISNYFLQDLWGARKVISSGCKVHYDIGSRVDGFVAHLLAAGISVNTIDIRPFPSRIEGLNTIIDDATSLKQFSDNSIDSLSALCSLEHFGLGRYGDPIDPEACFKCFENMQKKIKEGGSIYLSVPVGRERVEFNAHRVFFAKTIIESFSRMKCVEYSCASNGCLEENVDIHKYDDDSHDGEYRYGLFHFVS